MEHFSHTYLTPPLTCQTRRYSVALKNCNSGQSDEPHNWSTSRSNGRVLQRSCPISVERLKRVMAHSDKPFPDRILAVFSYVVKVCAEEPSHRCMRISWWLVFCDLVVVFEWSVWGVGCCIGLEAALV